jgi:hypothetical protein
MRKVESASKIRRLFQYRPPLSLAFKLALLVQHFFCRMGRQLRRRLCGSPPGFSPACPSLDGSLARSSTAMPQLSQPAPFPHLPQPRRLGMRACSGGVPWRAEHRQHVDDRRECRAQQLLRLRPPAPELPPEPATSPGTPRDAATPSRVGSPRSAPRFPSIPATCRNTQPAPACAWSWRWPAPPSSTAPWPPTTAADGRLTLPS